MDPAFQPLPLMYYYYYFLTMADRNINIILCELDNYSTNDETAGLMSQR